MNYNMVSENEFFIESQEILNALLDAKHQLITQYPKTNTED